MRSMKVDYALHRTDGNSSDCQVDVVGVESLILASLT